MYIHMWHVYLYIYLVYMCNSSYQLTCSQRNQYRSQWRSNKARADLLQLYRLDLAPRIRWTCFCFLPFLPFLLSFFPKLSWIVCPSIVQLCSVTRNPLLIWQNFCENWWVLSSYHVLRQQQNMIGVAKQLSSEER